MVAGDQRRRRYPRGCAGRRTDRSTQSGRPDGMRVIVRRERPSVSSPSNHDWCTAAAPSPSTSSAGSSSSAWTATWPWLSRNDCATASCTPPPASCAWNADGCAFLPPGPGPPRHRRVRPDRGDPRTRLTTFSRYSARPEDPGDHAHRRDRRPATTPETSSHRQIAIKASGRNV